MDPTLVSHLPSDFGCPITNPDFDLRYPKYLVFLKLKGPLREEGFKIDCQVVNRQNEVTIEFNARLEEDKPFKSVYVIQISSTNLVFLTV